MIDRADDQVCFRARYPAEVVADDYGIMSRITFQSARDVQCRSVRAIDTAAIGEVRAIVLPLVNEWRASEDGCRKNDVGPRSNEAIRRL